MTPLDFVYLQIYKGCLAQGVSEKCARDFAIIGSDLYKKNKFSGGVPKLIKDKIIEAKKVDCKK